MFSQLVVAGFSVAAMLLAWNWQKSARYLIIPTVKKQARIWQQRWRIFFYGLRRIVWV